MIDIVKERIWGLLERKDVSLAMIYDRDGNILWHKGRPIEGKSVITGGGFSKTFIKEAFVSGEVVKRDGLIITESDTSARSFVILRIKSLMIKSICKDFFLYIDSGTRETFSETDCEIIRVIGEILGDMIRQIREQENDGGGLTGESDAIKAIRDLIIRYSMSDEPILLKGETGTGKSHIAKIIHNYSARKGKFKVVNTPGIPESLFESEMFGHTKGAFTDARADRTGLVEEAADGTLFIDEITEISVGLQAKLLRFIETGKYTRLGESTEREVNLRIVAATNKDLQKAIEKKEFREDLYYRLNVFEIELPPLRERKDDLKVLVTEMQPLLKGKKIGHGFWEAMDGYDWPGNVRELISVLKRSGYHTDETITGSDIREMIEGTAGPIDKKVKECAGIVSQAWANLESGQSFWEAVKKPYLNRDLNRSQVMQIIEMGLKETGGVYKTLMKRFNLETADYHRFMRFLHEQGLKPG